MYKPGHTLDIHNLHLSPPPPPPRRISRPRPEQPSILRRKHPPLLLQHGGRLLDGQLPHSPPLPAPPQPPQRVRRPGENGGGRTKRLHVSELGYEDSFAVLRLLRAHFVRATLRVYTCATDRDERSERQWRASPEAGDGR